MAPPASTQTASSRTHPLVYIVEGKSSLLGTKQDSMQATSAYLQKHHVELNDATNQDFTFKIDWVDPRDNGQVKRVILAEDVWSTAIQENNKLKQIIVIVRERNLLDGKGRFTGKIEAQSQNMPLGRFNRLTSAQEPHWGLRVNPAPLSAAFLRDYCEAGSKRPRYR